MTKKREVYTLKVPTEVTEKREIEAKKKREELKELLLEEKPGLILDRACQLLSM